MHIFICLQTCTWNDKIGIKEKKDKWNGLCIKKSESMTFKSGTQTRGKFNVEIWNKRCRKCFISLSLLMHNQNECPSKLIHQQTTCIPTRQFNVQKWREDNRVTFLRHSSTQYSLTTLDLVNHLSLSPSRFSSRKEEFLSIGSVTLADNFRNGYKLHQEYIQRKVMTDIALIFCAGLGGSSPVLTARRWLPYERDRSY